VRVAVLAVMVMLVPVPMLVRLEGLRSVRKTKMSVRPCMSVSVDAVSVSVQYACVRAAHPEKP
jgi:hypothetical protein